MHFLTEIARTFSGFITGTGAANSLAIFNPEFVDAVRSQTEGRGDTRSIEEVIYNIRLDIMSRIIDSSFGAFHVYDILNNPYVFAGVSGITSEIKNSLQDYVVFVYEDLNNRYKTEIGPVILVEEDFDSNGFNTPCSIRALLAESEEQVASPPTADGPSVPEVAEPATVFICNANPKQPSLEAPGLSAIVIKDSALSVQAKNAHFLSVFFNAIPPIEMSKCVPYMSLTFYEKNFASGPDDFLNQTAYFRFDLREGSDGVELNDNIFNNVREVNARLDEELNAQATFMNIFTSPQTMNNADINREVSGIFSDSGEPTKVKKGRVLEPFAPMLSLRNLDISTTSGGYGITTSRRANMSLFLHDRSRMIDVAPLISVNQLVQTTVKIEFGWSHPDSSVFNQSDGNQNEIGVFLNSMRDVQYYTLNTSDVSLDGPGANINLKLSAFGYVEKNIVPASCGRLAPLSLVSKQIISAIDKILKTSEAYLENEKPEVDIPSIHQPLKVLRSTVASGYAAVDALMLRDFLTKIRKGNADPTDIVRQVFLMFGFSEPDVSTLGLIPGNSISAISKEKIRKLLSRFNSTSVSKNNYEELIRKKDKLLASQDFFRSPRVEKRLSDINKRFIQPPIPTFNPTYYPSDLIDEIDNDGIPRISLGSLMCSFVGAPMLSTGQFSEVQMIFYPINNKAGGARIHTTASLPIRVDSLNSAFDKLHNIEENTFNANFTASSIIDFFSNLVLSENTLYYGTNNFATSQALSFDDITPEEMLATIPTTIEDAFNDYVSSTGDAELKLETLSKTNKETIAQRFYNKIIKDQQLLSLAKIYHEDGLPEVDTNTLVKPVIKAKFETLPAINPNPILKSGGESSTLGKISNFLNGEDLSGSGTGYYDSSKILRIHIFDTNVTTSHKADLIKDMLDNIGIKTAGQDVSSNEADPGVSSDTKTRIDGNVPSAKIKVPNISGQDLKAYVKRQFPSITYGAYNSVIRSLSVNSTTADSIAQARAIDTEVARREGRTSKGERGNSADSEVTVFPANLKVEMLGIPFIAMGNQIYVDLGTNTDLDNVYMVNSVTHTISPGSFTTSCDLKLQNQGMVRNLRGDISKAIEKLVVE